MRDKQAKLVQLSQLVTAVTAHVNKEQLLRPDERLSPQRHVIAIRPFNTRIAINMHLVLIAKPFLAQQGISLFWPLRCNELYVVQFDIGTRCGAAHIEHQ
ncbi:hypothetical protein D3C71_1493960 [compost metagenome]